MIAGTRAFADGSCDELVDRELLARFAAGAEPAWRTIARSSDDPAATGLIAYAPGDRTATWRLPAELHRSAQATPRSVVVLTTALDERATPLRDACLAYGLTGWRPGWRWRPSAPARSRTPPTTSTSPTRPPARRWPRP